MVQNIRENEKQSDGSYITKHKETNAEIVLYNTGEMNEDGSPVQTNVQKEIDDLKNSTSNIPNVGTNDQTPTYTESGTLVKMTSGEKLSVAFGKISKAITDLIAHLADNVRHITSTERSNWNSAKTHADSAHAPSNAQANQNAFSNIKVGDITISADTTTDTLTLVGSNVTITPDATNDKVTIAVASGSTSTKGIVQLTNSTSSTSTTTAATPNSVKSAYDLANTAKTNATTAQSKADSAYTLAESKVDSLSDLGVIATATELNYMDGVTSNVQTQLDGKAPSSHISDESVHFTETERAKLSGIAEGAQKNTVTGVKGSSESTYRTGNINITKANIGLSNVNNTSDANKPVSTAQQAALDGHNTNTSAHNDIRNLISDLTTRLNALADSDDTTLDQMSEIVAYIKSNKSLIDSVTTNKVNVSDIVNNLTTANTSKVLSANQGVEIKKLIDALQTTVNGKANSGHTHDDRYYTESEINTKLSDKANTSHGNHVPTTETANNAKFLRNDNTWQTVTPENIGAAKSSHGTHVSYSSTAPVMDGTASVGSASTVARSDHKHPIDTSRASKTEFDTHTSDTTKHITSAERTSWNSAKAHASSAHAPSNAQANVIETVKVNGTALTPSSKAVDITVPSVGNGTITITQNGTTKGTFTTNQSGNTTIALTDTNTNTTYSAATTSTAGLMSATDKSKLNGIESGANKYTLPTASSTLGGVKTTSNVTDPTNYTPCPIIEGVPYYKEGSGTSTDFASNNILIPVDYTLFTLNEETQRYEQTITVSGMIEGMGGTFDILRSGAILTEQESLIIANITDIVRQNGSIKVICLEQPTANYTLVLYGTYPQATDETTLIANMNGWFTRVEDLESNVESLNNKIEDVSAKISQGVVLQGVLTVVSFDEETGELVLTSSDTV